MFLWGTCSLPPTPTPAARKPRPLSPSSPPAPLLLAGLRAGTHPPARQPRGRVCKPPVPSLPGYPNLCDAGVRPSFVLIFSFPGQQSQPSPWAASDAETLRFSPSDWVRRGPGLAINSWEWRFSRNKFLPLWARGTDLVNLGFTALEPVFSVASWRVSVYPSRLTLPCEADLYRL